MSDKIETQRSARAEGWIKMAPATMARVQSDDLPKPGVLATARAAGLLAVKRTPDLIPHCHPLPIDAIELIFEFAQSGLRVQAVVSTIAKTGVEMEALTAVNVALLVIYDMLKGIDSHMEMTGIRLLEKTGGKSDFHTALTSDFRVALLLTEPPAKAEKMRAQVLRHLQPFGVSGLTFEESTQDAQTMTRVLKRWIQDGVTLILTVGGSGLDAADQTVEVVTGLIERPVPGVMEAARAYGQRRSPYAMLSRGVAGQAGRSFLVTLPGSTRGLSESLQAILPGLIHGLCVAQRKVKS